MGGGMTPTIGRGQDRRMNYPGQVLVHPFYISWTGRYDWSAAGNFELLEPEERDCQERFGPTEPQYFAPADDLDDTDAPGRNNYGDQDGLLDYDSKLPCYISIVNATTRSKYAQRRYANYVFGAAWVGQLAPTGLAGGDNTDAMFEYVSYGPRDFHKRDYDMNDIGDATNGGDNNPLNYGAFHPQMGQLVPNIWATQDSVFQLMQVSGFFLAFGIIFHILAFLMGGFMWNYSKLCCDFGICAFVFNSIVWASLSLVSYIICICSFAGVLYQGVERPKLRDVAAPTHDGHFAILEKNQLEVKWSVGGALIITGIVFSAIAISLASYQWAVDSKKDEDDKMEAAVEQAVRRVSGGV